MATNNKHSSPLQATAMVESVMVDKMVLVSNGIGDRRSDLVATLYDTSGEMFAGITGPSPID